MEKRKFVSERTKDLIADTLVVLFQVLTVIAVAVGIIGFIVGVVIGINQVFFN